MTYLNSSMGASPNSSNAVIDAATQGGRDGADTILWAAAQGRMLAKLQMYSTMAKQVNDQQ